MKIGSETESLCGCESDTDEVMWSVRCHGNRRKPRWKPRWYGV